jgi:hypothetical protein
MTLPPSDRIGPYEYEIVAPLGAPAFARTEIRHALRRGLAETHNARGSP